MKESSYNFVLYDDSWGYWYNALTGFYFRLSKKLSQKVQNTITAGNIQNLQTSSVLYKTLVDHGFLIGESIDELELIRQNHRNAVNRRSCP
jgi:hypothetical protein